MKLLLNFDVFALNAVCLTIPLLSGVFLMKVCLWMFVLLDRSLLRTELAMIVVLLLGGFQMGTH